MRVSSAYGERWPHAASYVGQEGIVVERQLADDWNAYVAAVLDCDGQVGLFLRDELVTAGE